MAENVAVTTLEIKGIEKVATSMKELKKQIADYRDELVALGQIEDKNEQQMEEQARVIEKLRKATKLLSDVTNAHKTAEGNLNKTIDRNTASYNELQAEMSRLKKLYKEMSAMERDSAFGAETLQSISQLDVKLKELDAGMGQYQRNVGNYGMTFEQSMNQARQSSGYLAQGIGSLASTMNLLGVENEDLKKGIAGLQIATQFFSNEGVAKLIVKLKESITAKKAAREAAKAQAIQAKATASAMSADAVATQGATTATNTFKKALIATGIGAFVVAVGVLIANWKELKKLFSSSVGDLEAIKKQYEDLQTSMENNIALMKAKGATDEEVLVAEINMLTTLVEKYDDLALSLTNLKDFIFNKSEFTSAQEKATEKQEELNEKFMEAELHLQSIIASGKIAYDERYMTDYEKSLAKINRQYADMNDLRNELFKVGDMSAKEYQQLGADIETWYQQQMELLNEARQKAMDERLKATREAEQKEREERNKARQKMLEDQAKYEEAAIAEEERYGDELAAELDRQLQQELEAKRAAAEAEKQILLDTLKAHEEATQQEKELAEQKKQMYIDSAHDAASSTSSILGSIADTIESVSENDEEAAKKTKGLRIASTLIDTISGATGAYMQAVKSIPPPVGIAVGAAQAGAVLATGMANIAKMKAASVGSSLSSSLSSSVSAPNVPTQLDSVRNVTSASEEDRLNRMAQDQKVYILESDIEAAGAASRARVAESSF